MSAGQPVAPHQGEGEDESRSNTAAVAVGDAEPALTPEPEGRAAYKRPESVLVVVLTWPGEFLLLRRSEPAGFWQSVTGSLEAGEGARLAAVRELREETGLQVSPSRLLMPLSFLSIPGAKEVGVEVHSMSKGFHMIGWRLGWVCGHEKLVRAFADVKDNSDSGQFIAIQKAAAAALADPDIPRQVREKYRRRLEKLVGVLRAVGFECEMPGGTYFLYTKSPTGAGDLAFANASEAGQFLIKELSISTVPWDDCGAFTRFSVTYEAEDEAAEDDLMAELHRRLAGARLKFS